MLTKKLMVILGTTVGSTAVIVPSVALSINHEIIPEFSIYGNVQLEGTTQTNGSATYTAIAKNGVDFTNGAVWTLKSVSSNFSINRGVLSWHGLNEGVYDLTISCVYHNHAVSHDLNVSLKVITMLPVENKLDLFGNPTLVGIENDDGSAQYTAITNIGRNLTSASQWKVEAKSGTLPSGISISAGKLSWTKDLAVNNYDLVITATYSGLPPASIEVKLTISNKPIPETSINIFGENKLIAIANQQDTANFSALTNNGKDVTDTATWTVTNTTGQTLTWVSISKGILTWTKDAPIQSNELTISCQYSTLPKTSLQLTLIIIETPPAESEAKIYGTNTLEGELNKGGEAEYSAISNVGRDLTSDSKTKWNVTDVEGKTISGVSISQGKLTWDDKLTKGSHSMLISMSYDNDRYKYSVEIQLSIIETQPAESSIVIYGASSLTSQDNKQGQATYSAITNIGDNVSTNATWSLTNQPTGVTIDKGVLSWTAGIEPKDYKITISCTYNQLTVKNIDVDLEIISTTPTNNPPAYMDKKYSSETDFSVVLAQNETRDIHFATPDAKTNNNLIYSYSLFGTMNNVKINSFSNIQQDPTYGTCGVLNITANQIQSSYAYVMMIYVYDTVMWTTDTLKMPLTISIVDSPTKV